MRRLRGVSVRGESHESHAGQATYLCQPTRRLLATTAAPSICLEPTDDKHCRTSTAAWRQVCALGNIKSLVPAASSPRMWADAPLATCASCKSSRRRRWRSSPERYGNRTGLYLVQPPPVIELGPAVHGGRSIMERAQQAGGAASVRCLRLPAHLERGPLFDGRRHLPHLRRHHRNHRPCAGLVAKHASA